MKQARNLTKYRDYKISLVILIYILIASVNPALAGPTSTNYELKQYGFGAGGESMSSSNYKAHGAVGEVDTGQGSSANYKSGDGLNFTLQANTPLAPTLSNPGSNYDRLKIVIATGGNATDATYAIAISSDNFVTTQYVQSDLTVGTALGIEDFMTYTTLGGASGSIITGLSPNTTYTVKVKARKGNYTETGYGPATSSATILPSLSFGISASTLSFSNLNSNNSYTDSSKTTTLTTSTNAYNGYVINARTTGLLTFASNTIAAYTGTNASPTTWAGTGFGYTTSDSNLTGGTPDRFTNGGPKYAGFTTATPGDPVANHPGPVISNISNEQFTISYRVTAPSSQRAGTYQTTVMYMVVPSY